MKPGAVDIVRHWQELGYIILYVTGRPDMQLQRVVSWLAQVRTITTSSFFSKDLIRSIINRRRQAQELVKNFKNHVLGLKTFKLRKPNLHIEVEIFIP